MGKLLQTPKYHTTAPPSSGNSAITPSIKEINSSTSGLSLGSTFKHLLTTSLTPSLMTPSSFGAPLLCCSCSPEPCLCLPLCCALPSSGNLQSPPSTHRLRLPPVSSLLASNGDLPTRQA